MRPIAAANPGEMYDAVRQFIAAESNARYSPENPGAPIAYSLHYLSDRSPARMSYAVDYVRPNCNPANNRPTTAPRISVNLSRIDANAMLFLNGRELFNHNAPESGGARNTVLNEQPGWRVDRPNTIAVRLGNHDCFGSSLDLRIVGGATAEHRVWEPGWSHCGWQLEWTYSIDPASGAITRLS